MLTLTSPRVVMLGASPCVLLSWRTRRDMPNRQVWSEEASRWKDQTALQFERGHCWPCCRPRNTRAFVQLIHSLTVMRKDTNLLAHWDQPATSLPTITCNLYAFLPTPEKQQLRQLVLWSLAQGRSATKQLKLDWNSWVSWCLSIHDVQYFRETKSICTLCHFLRTTPESLIVSKLEGEKNKAF